MYQMVHDYFRAWHAGVSHWREFNDLNSWAVGVEIVNTGDQPFTGPQVPSSSNIINICLLKLFPLFVQNFSNFFLL